MFYFAEVILRYPRDMIGVRFVRVSAISSMTAILCTTVQILDGWHQQKPYHISTYSQFLAPYIWLHADWIQYPNFILTTVSHHSNIPLKCSLNSSNFIQFINTADSLFLSSWNCTLRPLSVMNDGTRQRKLPEASGRFDNNPDPNIQGICSGNHTLPKSSDNDHCWWFRYWHHS
jgi:hypothetical protein